ncbi:uncharacterized protein LOC106673273 isoform X2 [Cimex lectularius]|nr:uncharacterized protein LOC106673273 isoform X2 [Cimex lectularius]
MEGKVYVEKGTFCAVKNCNSSYHITRHLSGDEAINYFRCPRDEAVKMKWIEACGRAQVQYVCSLHFEEEQLVRDHENRSVSLQPGSIPTLNLPKNETAEDVVVEQVMLMEPVSMPARGTKPIARKSTVPPILKKPMRKKDDDDLEEFSRMMESEVEPVEKSESVEKITEEELLECLSSPSHREEEKTEEVDPSLPEAYVLLSKCDLPENTTTVYLENENKLQEEKECCVGDCPNTESTRIRGKPLMFYEFPKDSKARRKWIEWTKVHPKRMDPIYICSDHFTLADFDEKNETELKSYAVPSKKPRREERMREEAPPEKQGRSRLKSTHVVRHELESEPEEDEEAKKAKKAKFSPKKTAEEEKKARKSSKLSGIKCCVEGCLTKQGDGLHFYPFPNEKPVRAAWLVASKYSGPMTETTAVCSRHFLAKDFVPTPGSVLPSTRLRRGTIPSKFLPDKSKKFKATRKRKILKESSSEDEGPDSYLDQLPPEIRKGLEQKEEKTKKLGKKIEIIAEFDEENDGSIKKSYKVVIKKIKRKGPEGERKRGLLMDCKNSLILVKKIIEGLDITRMQEIKFKPGDVEESRVVLTGTGGGPKPQGSLPVLTSLNQGSMSPVTTLKVPVVKTQDGQAFVRVPNPSGQQVQISLPQSFIVQGQQQQPLLLLQGQGLQKQVLLKAPPLVKTQDKSPSTSSLATTTATTTTASADKPILPKSNAAVKQDEEKEKRALNSAEELAKMEDEMAKCKLAFELQR